MNEISFGAVRENVEQNGGRLTIPLSDISPEVLLLYVVDNPYVINHIDARYITNDMATAAVSANGLLLADLPINLRTLELCNIAVANAPGSIQDVPHTLVTKNMIISAVSRFGALIHLLILEDLTDDVIELALMQDGTNIQYVDKSSLNISAWYKIAVLSNPEAIRFVPLDAITQELATYSIMKEPYTIPYIPATIVSEITTDVTDMFPLEQIKTACIDLTIDDLRRFDLDELKSFVNDDDYYVSIDRINSYV